MRDAQIGSPLLGSFRNWGPLLFSRGGGSIHEGFHDVSGSKLGLKDVEPQQRWEYEYACMSLYLLNMLRNDLIKTCNTR